MTSLKVIDLKNKEQIIKYRNKILDNLEICKDKLNEMIIKQDSLTLFKNIKYNKTVIDPLTEKSENFIEMVNQNQTYLVSLKAAQHLLNEFPNTIFRVNLGNVSGYDIVSKDDNIIAECFAATSYRSNSKLTNELKKLEQNTSAEHKYVFFYDMEFTDTNREYYENKYPDIKIVHFTDVV